MKTIAWGSLVVFLSCMVALGLGSDDWRVVVLAAVMALVCCWAFAVGEEKTTSNQAPRAVSPYLDDARPATPAERAEWASVSPHFERGER